MYYVLILCVGIERLVELVVSKRNASWAFDRGGKEYGHAHYPVMVILHAGFLIGCVVEVWALNRPFLPWLAWPMLLVAVAAQVLRWWCITTLGRRWNTLVIVVPDLPLVNTGPYKHNWLRHPNYLAVVVEGVALPLIHTAWITAVCFTVANALLLNVRIRVENEALGYSRLRHK